MGPVLRQLCPHRIQKSSEKGINRSKGARENKFQCAARMELPELFSPLSKLTKHWTHIPIRDMEDWVRRPIETRHQTSKVRGKVVRPMNCFLLYRSAYAGRIIALTSRENHQVVSQIAGMSWNLETMDIKQKFRDLASVEKDNHATAHPNYRFAPKFKKEQAHQEKKPLIVNSPSNFDWDLSLNEIHARCSLGDDATQKSHPSVSMNLGNLGKSTMTCFGSSWLAQGPGTLFYNVNHNTCIPCYPQRLQDPESVKFLHGQLCTIDLQIILRHILRTALAALPVSIYRDPFNSSPSQMREMLEYSGMHPPQLQGFYHSSSSFAGQQISSSAQYPMWLESSYFPISKALFTPNPTPCLIDSYLVGEFNIWDSELGVQYWNNQWRLPARSSDMVDTATTGAVLQHTSLPWSVIPELHLDYSLQSFNMQPKMEAEKN